MVKALLTHRIEVAVDDLPLGAEDALREALSIPNLAKQKAAKLDQWGWESLPDTIDLWRIEDHGGQDWLSMPRGFYADFVQGMKHFGHDVEVRDCRVFDGLFRIGSRVELRRWQIPAERAILDNQQGIYKAPAGSGKTVTMLSVIRQLACKSLVIVNTKDILWQWRERAHQFLGEHYPVGQIGDGEVEISPYLTIATAQTLHSRYDQLEADGVFDMFSLVCLDECHHAQAETYNYLLDRFSARYRVGVSATPDKTGDFALATNVLGPVFHETKPNEVTSLQKPSVVRVPTQFTFGFRGHTSRFQRSNYGQMVESLVRNAPRNALIVSKIMEHTGHHQLVVTKRLEHIDLLEALLYDAGCPDPIYRLTGQDTNDHRKMVKAAMDDHPCVVLSTVADEALDVPRLDRLHLPFPQKNAGLVTQIVGRVERKAEGKTDAIIFDYVDGKVGPLEKQWRVRRFDVYEVRGYRISIERMAA